MEEERGWILGWGPQNAKNAVSPSVSLRFPSGFRRPEGYFRRGSSGIIPRIFPNFYSGPFEFFFSLVFPFPTSYPTLCWWISHELPINTHEYLGLLLSQRA